MSSARWRRVKGMRFSPGFRAVGSASSVGMRTPRQPLAESFTIAIRGLIGCDRSERD